MIEKGSMVQVLDHGYVKLIDWMGTDETIIEAARMSTKKGFISWEAYDECSKCGLALLSSDTKPAFHADGCDGKMVMKPDGDEGLLEFLWRNSHATPFEMCEIAIEVQAPIMVFREWHRHRTQAYNELSARYTQMPDLHYLPERTRFQQVISKNKQEASLGVADASMPDNFRLAAEAQQKEVYGLYDRMLKKGVPKEVARLNTPVSRYSRMRAKTDLRNWLAFLNLRMRPSAQWEIRQFANEVGNIIKALYPRTWKLFEEYTLYAESFGRTELTIMRRLFADYGEASNLLEALSKRSGMSDKHLKIFLAKLKAA